MPRRFTRKKSKGSKRRSPSPEQFEVEQLLDERMGAKGRLEMFVKWKNYDDPAENTWEDKEQLCREVPEMVDQFEVARRQNLDASEAGPSGSRGDGLQGQVQAKETPQNNLMSEEKHGERKQPFVDQSAEEEAVGHNSGAAPVDASSIISDSLSGYGSPLENTSEAAESEIPSNHESDGDTVMNDDESSGDEEDNEKYLPLPGPNRVYRVTQGIVISRILALSQVEGSPTALVKYENEPDLIKAYELVPTTVIKQHQPAILAAYYESKLRFVQ